MYQLTRNLHNPCVLFYSRVFKCTVGNQKVARSIEIKSKKEHIIGVGMD